MRNKSVETRRRSGSSLCAIDHQNRYLYQLILDRVARERFDKTVTHLCRLQDEPPCRAMGDVSSVQNRRYTFRVSVF